ncbi:hypothetical protein BDP27DRAFT_1336223 [Rhodocollybia butyracea]|uniref:HNH nuclease domain-containing protein n=1 Tax=Rhodocollybia butyracea TaxID=206335 RepID=A0A9P5U1B4_9AGAR|nr:hypothetical protein BDP27DRAFT_1336223 [Rhodocollybia butyracea]
MTSRSEGQPLPSIREATQRIQSTHAYSTSALGSLQSDAVSAYHVCLDTERQATNQVQDSELDVIRARVLGYLILEASSVSALAEIVKVIHSCNASYDKLCKLGQSFMDYFIRAFRKFKGNTPGSSSHPSRTSFDKDKEKVKTEIEQARASWTAAKQAALKRDSNRCMVKGVIDFNSLALFDTATQQQAGGGFTQCAHIVPDSTYFSLSDGEKKDYAASVLAVLQRFGYDINKINGSKVHSLFNIMTLDHPVHELFDRLKCWFEATAIENQYRVVLAPPYLHTVWSLPQQVTFKSSDPDNLPLPSPELLALHAACARVAHLSGAAEHVDKLNREAESSTVLATDGGSSELLNYAVMQGMRSIHIGA